MNSAEQVAVELRKIPGSRAEAYYSLAHGCHAVDWLYACPCGEKSSWACLIDDNDPRSAASWVEYAKEAMRRHVRSEGNEPSF